VGLICMQGPSQKNEKGRQQRTQHGWYQPWRPGWHRCLAPLAPWLCVAAFSDGLPFDVDQLKTQAPGSQVNFWQLRGK